MVEQVLGHYFAAWGGRHLAEDVTDPAGGAAAVNAPVYAVADGVVRYAGPNSSTYLHVVLIEHDLADGSAVCSFYGHINAPLVAAGDVVTRGQPIASVADWAVAGGGPTSNTHLHYVLLSKQLCDASAAAGGGLVCGYDSGGESGVSEPGRRARPLHLGRRPLRRPELPRLVHRPQPVHRRPPRRRPVDAARAASTGARGAWWRQESVMSLRRAGTRMAGRRTSTAG